MVKHIILWTLKSELSEEKKVQIKQGFLLLTLCFLMS